MLKPQATIRRFDVFAEYNRQQAMKQGMRADQAKGYGLWLAKIVAARRFGTTKGTATPARKSTEKVSHGKWRKLSGKPQTDKLFDKEIVNRMGSGFYRRVFVPAIRTARDDDKSYKDIRDTIRSEWKP